MGTLGSLERLFNQDAPGRGQSDGTYILQSRSWSQHIDHKMAPGGAGGTWTARREGFRCAMMGNENGSRNADSLKSSAIWHHGCDMVESTGHLYVSPPLLSINTFILFICPPIYSFIQQTCVEISVHRGKHHPQFCLPILRGHPLWHT